jgi:hypothetical protein
MTDTTTTPTPPEGLTDERLLELAAKHMEDDYGAINPDEYDPLDEKSLEVYVSELLAFARAAIAADRAARPTPTPEEIEATFRQWWAESYPHAPVGNHAVGTHVAFALRLMGGEVQ